MQQSSQSKASLIEYIHHLEGARGKTTSGSLQSSNLVVLLRTASAASARTTLSELPADIFAILLHPLRDEASVACAVAVRYARTDKSVTHACMRALHSEYGSLNGMGCRSNTLNGDAGLTLVDPHLRLSCPPPGPGHCMIQCLPMLACMGLVDNLQERLQ